ncbi:hypothetical protein K9L27_00565 [Candidatus Gracilibacteria bacterium]|nr:hypothetical protein [Candidatus Gracilibacteria bacterium]
MEKEKVIRPHLFRDEKLDSLDLEKLSTELEILSVVDEFFTEQERKAKDIWERLKQDFVRYQENPSLLDEALLDFSGFMKDLRFAIMFLPLEKRGQIEQYDNFFRIFRERFLTVDLSYLEGGIPVQVVLMSAAEESIIGENANIDTAEGLARAAFQTRLATTPPVLLPPIRETDTLTIIKDKDGNETEIPLPGTFATGGVQQILFPGFQKDITAGEPLSKDESILYALETFPFIAQHFEDLSDSPMEQEKLIRDMNIFLMRELRSAFSYEYVLAAPKNKKLWTGWANKHKSLLQNEESETKKLVIDILKTIILERDIGSPIFLREYKNRDTVRDRLFEVLGNPSEVFEERPLQIQRKKKPKKKKRPHSPNPSNKVNSDKICNPNNELNEAKKEKFFEIPRISHQFGGNNLDFSVEDWPEGANLHACVICSEKGKKDKTERITFSKNTEEFSLRGIRDRLFFEKNREEKHFKIIFHFFPEKNQPTKEYEAKALKFETKFDILKKEKNTRFATLDVSRKKNAIPIDEIDNVGVVPEIQFTNGAITNIINTPPKEPQMEDLLILALLELGEGGGGNIEIIETTPGIYKFIFSAEQFQTIDKSFSIFLNKEGRIIGDEFPSVKNSAREALLPILGAYISRKEKSKIQNFYKWESTFLQSPEYNGFLERAEEFQEECRNYFWLGGMKKGKESNFCKGLGERLEEYGIFLNTDGENIYFIFRIEGSEYVCGVVVDQNSDISISFPGALEIPKSIQNELRKIVETIAQFATMRLTPDWIKNRPQNPIQKSSDEIKTKKEYSKIPYSLKKSALSALRLGEGRVAILDEEENLINVLKNQTLDDAREHEKVLLKDFVFRFQADSIGEKSSEEEKTNGFHYSAETYQIWRDKLAIKRNRKYLSKRVISTVKIMKGIDRSPDDKEPIRDRKVQGIIETILKELHLWDKIEETQHMGDLLEGIYKINGKHWLDDMVNQMEGQMIPVGYSRAVVVDIQKLQTDFSLIQDLDIQKAKEGKL